MYDRRGAFAPTRWLAIAVLAGASAFAAPVRAQSFPTVDLPSFEFPQDGAFARAGMRACRPLPCVDDRLPDGASGEAVSRNSGGGEAPRPPGRE